MKSITTVVLGLGLMMAACGQDEPAQPAEPEAVPAAAPMPLPPAPTPPAPPELSDDDVAVAEDFIEEATTEVTAANYKTTLDAIDQEISADPQ